MSRQFNLSSEPRVWQTTTHAADSIVLSLSPKQGQTALWSALTHTCELNLQSLSAVEHFSHHYLIRDEDLLPVIKKPWETRAGQREQNRCWHELLPPRAN